MTTSLRVEVGGLTLRNPVLVASGTFGAGLEAQEHGVDLSQVSGTGLGGRITRDDLLRYVEGAKAPETPPPVAPSIQPVPQPSPAADEEYGCRKEYRGYKD